MCCCFGWLFYQGLSGLDSLAFGVHQKSAYVAASRTLVSSQKKLCWSSSIHKQVLFFCYCVLVKIQFVSASWNFPEFFMVVEIVFRGEQKGSGWCSNNTRNSSNDRGGCDRLYWNPERFAYLENHLCRTFKWWMQAEVLQELVSFVIMHCLCKSKAD